MSEPTCSVIIPCYNGAAFVGEAITSVLSQTAPPREVIVVDDGSTDDSADIAERFGPPVRVVRQANAGVAAARNCGVRESRSEWIAFLDADDAWEPTKLAEQFQKANEGCGFVYCNAANIGAHDNLAKSRERYLREGWVFQPLLMGNFVTTSGVLIRRDILTHTRGFDGRFSPAEDWAVWLEAATRTAFGCVRTPLVRYRFHAGGISRDTERMYASSLAILAWVRDLPESRDIPARVWRIARATIESRRGLGYALAGDPRAAMRAYLRAVAMNPGNRRLWWATLRTGIGTLGY